MAGKRVQPPSFYVHAFTHVCTFHKFSSFCIGIEMLVNTASTCYKLHASQFDVVIDVVILTIPLYKIYQIRQEKLLLFVYGDKFTHSFSDWLPLLLLSLTSEFNTKSL